MYYKDNEPEEYFTLKNNPESKFKGTGSTPSSSCGVSMGMMCQKINTTLLLGLCFIFLGYVVPEVMVALSTGINPVIPAALVNVEVIFTLCAILFMFITYTLLL